MATEDFNVDYTCRNMTLTVRMAEEDAFEILYAAVSGCNIPQAQLNQLISETEALRKNTTDEKIYSDTDNESNIFSEVDSSNSSFPARSYSTPLRVKKAQVGFPSPTSVASLPAEHVHYYDAMFVQSLATNFFDSIPAPAPLVVVEPHQPLLISIEGNIGAGKSTLLRALRDAHPDWTFIDEPIDTWTALKNNTGNLLECFYGNQARWAYTFQNCSILSRFQLIEKAILENKDKYSGKHIYVTERSLGTDYHVFAKMLKEDGKLDELEFELYERWLAELEKTCTPLSGIVLVDTAPQTCVNRIKNRNREGEEGIPLSYLELLNTFQNRWLDNIDIPCKKTSTQEGIEEFVADILSR